MDINIGSILKLLWHKLWIILICVIVGAATFYLVTDNCIEKRYDSEVKILINYNSGATGAGSGNTDLSYSKNVAVNCIEMLKQNKFSSELAEEMKTNGNNPEYSSKKYNVGMALSVVTNTSIIRLVFTTNDAEISYELAVRSGTLVQEYLQANYPQADDDSFIMSVINVPMKPDGYVSPSLMKNTTLGFIAALIISIVVIILVAFFDNRVKDTETLSEKYGISVIGIIPDIDMSKQEK